MYNFTNMMVNDLIKVGDELTRKYVEYLDDINCPYIKYKKADGNWHMKLKMKYVDDKSFSFNRLHAEILEFYIKAGLAKKDNATIVISEINLTPIMISPKDYNEYRGVIVVLRYEVDGVPIPMEASM